MKTSSSPSAWPAAADLLETEEAITFVKETFAKELARQLHLVKVSAPLVVLDGLAENALRGRWPGLRDHWRVSVPCQTPSPGSGRRSVRAGRCSASLPCICWRC